MAACYGLGDPLPLKHTWPSLTPSGVKETGGPQAKHRHNNGGHLVAGDRHQASVPEDLAAAVGNKNLIVLPKNLICT
jgi:hypothetical protein